jgi:lysophospholipase L1-like esterase
LTRKNQREANRCALTQYGRDACCANDLRSARRTWMGERMERCLGLLLVVLLVGLAACSLAGEEGSHQTDDVRPATAHRQTTVTKGRADASTIQGEPTASEVTAAEATPAIWDYVALGDSLAVGVGAHRGYVERYAAHINSDTGARVEVLNLGVSGQTSSELLYALRMDGSMRRAVGAAEVVTINIGINDLGHAGHAYKNGTCGGGDGQDCLRMAVEELEENWDAIVAELLSLRSTEDTVIRTAGLGYTPRVAKNFEPYVAKVNRHVATTAATHGIPHAQPSLGEGHMSPDGVHPNDAGYEHIADRLRELGYGPLDSPR